MTSALFQHRQSLPRDQSCCFSAVELSLEMKMVRAIMVEQGGSGGLHRPSGAVMVSVHS